MIELIPHKIEVAIDIASSFLDTRYPVNIHNICQKFDINVINNQPLNKDGYLICHRNKKIILINGKITNRHRQRFIIAHELGHYLLHRDQLYSCDRISDTIEKNVNSPLQEIEANQFANELLIPKIALSEYIPVGPVKLSNILDVATTFDVSITHAAIQTVTASNDETEILLCYDSQKLKWYKSASKNLFAQAIPKTCPVQLDLAAQKQLISGAWTELYHGTVLQEVHHIYGNQYLVLLSGCRL